MWMITVSGKGDHVAKMVRELGDAEKHGLADDEKHAIESAIRAVDTYLHDYRTNQVNANISGRTVKAGESHRFTATIQVYQSEEGEDGS